MYTWERGRWCSKWSGNNFKHILYHNVKPSDGRLKFRKHPLIMRRCWFWCYAVLLGHMPINPWDICTSAVSIKGHQKRMGNDSTLFPLSAQPPLQRRNIHFPFQNQIFILWTNFLEFSIKSRWHNWNNLLKAIHPSLS